MHVWVYIHVCVYIYTYICTIYDPSFGQNRGIQKKMFASYNHKASQEISENNISLQTKRQKEPEETIVETCGCVRSDQVNRWPSSM